MKNKPVITRFAPSPTGYLHVGHARAAREAFDFAARHNGTCLLRIEDIDHTRCKPEYTDGIYEDLEWLGFDWPKPVRVQSQHRSDYEHMLEQLYARGLIYRCFKLRREIAALTPKGQAYQGAPDPNEAQRLANKERFAWRLSLAEAQRQLGATFNALRYEETGLKPGWVKARPQRHGDVVLARKDIGLSYHLCVTHDDHLQGVTHVVRGVDLKEQTDIHVLLYTLMGWEQPIYYHHDIVRNNKGRKLSKRNKDTTLRSLRARRFTPEKLLNSSF